MLSGIFNVAEPCVGSFVSLTRKYSTKMVPWTIRDNGCEVSYVNDKYNRREYKLDFWEEFKRRWMVFGVMAALLGAIISPGIGAHGGILRSEYTSYVPLTYIYLSAGANSDWECMKQAWRQYRFHLCTQTHIFVVTPVLVAILVQWFEVLGTDGQILRGALLSSCGGTNSWLSVGLQIGSVGHHHAVISASVASGLAVLVMPMSLFIVCGSASIHPLGGFLSSCLTATVPFGLGYALRQGVANGICRYPLVRSAVVLLLYMECCTELLRAEGQLNVVDVLLTFGLVCMWFGASSVVCYAIANYLCPQHTTQAMLCSIHKSFYTGWHTSLSCSTSGLSRLPAVLAAPAQAAMLATLHCHGRQQCHSDECIPLVCN